MLNKGACSPDTFTSTQEHRMVTWDRGLATRNELREILNLPPLPEPVGSSIPARGEYYNVNEDEPDPDEGKLSG